jgi:hypothetical protein
MLSHKIQKGLTGALGLRDQVLGTKKLPSPAQVTTPKQDEIKSPASLPSPAEATKPAVGQIKSPAALPAAPPMSEAVPNEKKVNKKTW